MQRASVGSGSGRHSGATRSLMDLRDGGWRLDGIVVARCWLEGESQQLRQQMAGAPWPFASRPGACSAGVYPTGRTGCGWAILRHNAPLGAVTHGLGLHQTSSCPLVLSTIKSTNQSPQDRAGRGVQPFALHSSPLRPPTSPEHALSWSLRCSLSAPVSRSLKPLSKPAQQCPRGAPVPASSVKALLLFARYIQMYREGLFNAEPTRPHPSHPSLSDQPLWEV